MKIAVPSMLPTLDACVGTQFHQSKYLLIVDSCTMEYEAMTNPLLLLSGPAAGKLFALQLLEENVATVLANSCNSSILESLVGVGIRVIVGKSGSVRRAVEQFKEMCLADTVVIDFDASQD